MGCTLAELFIQKPLFECYSAQEEELFEKIFNYKEIFESVSSKDIKNSKIKKIVETKRNSLLSSFLALLNNQFSSVILSLLRFVPDDRDLSYEPSSSSFSSPFIPQSVQLEDENIDLWLEKHFRKIY